VPGKAKYAERMAAHLGEPIEAAAPITRPGGTTSQIGGTVGGVTGAAISSTARNRESDVQVGQFGWLGLGPAAFAITNANFLGKPTGEPLARVAYADVTQAELTDGKITIRVDLDLSDGRHIAFEAKRHGQNKPSVEVLELLRARCSG
jgi:hypothetical protein